MVYLKRETKAPAEMREKHILMIEMSERGKGVVENPESEEEELKRLFLEIMEGYYDAAIPPLSYFSPSPEIPSSTKRQKTDSERRRRDQMTENFSLLQSMVPSLLNAHRPRKERIIGDTVNYIKYLQEEADKLEGLVKLQREARNVRIPVLSRFTNLSSVNVTISPATFFAVQLPFRHGSVLNILKVLEKHRAEVMEARVSVNDEKVLTFTATVRLGSDGSNTVDKIRQEILTSLDLQY